MEALVNETKEAFHALGSKSFSRPSVEDSNKVFRRSLYFVKDVDEGEVITKESVRRIRLVSD